jgi:hypothetical protein
MIKRLTPWLAAALFVSGCSTQPLNRAAQRGDAAQVKALLDKGADPNKKGWVGETPLMTAAFHGKMPVVEALLAAGADVNARWRYGTPLSYAATRGNEGVVDLLVSKGAQVDDQVIEAAMENGFSALAVKLGRVRGQQVGAKEPSVDRPSYSAAAAAPRPDDVAVVVAVDEDNDAEAMTAHLKALGFAEDRVVSLQTRKASRTQLSAHLDEWLPSRVKPESMVVFYYSGKGAVDPKTGEALLMPFDFDAKFPQSTAVPLKRVYDSLAKLKAKKTLVVLDTAFPGAAKDALMPAGGLTTLLAAVDGQTAGALEKQRHGLFTYYLLQGLTAGKRAAQDLIDFAAPKVRDQAKRQGREQTASLLGPDTEI